VIVVVVATNPKANVVKTRISDVKNPKLSHGGS